jgi:hypothetical protein
MATWPPASRISAPRRSSSVRSFVGTTQAIAPSTTPIAWSSSRTAFALVASGESG